MVKIRLLALSMVALCLVAAGSRAQRDELPRRLGNLQTIHLPGRSRVEFREFHSSALGKRAQYSIYVPPAYDQEPLRQFPVIYFLHGMFNDHTSWAVGRYGNLPLLVENMLLESSLAQFLMVHPNGENSFYTDFLDGTLKYEEYIRLDLIREIEEHFRVKGGRSNRAIAGTSMGGYGALKIALKYSHIYSSAAAGSPIILLGEDPSQQMIHSSSSRAGFFADLFRPVFGIPFDPHHWKNNSVEVLARNRDLEDLNIYIAYGTADRYLRTFPMAEGIQEIHQILTQRGFSHIFRVYEGEPHGWKLLKLHLEEVLEFVTQTFE